MNDANFTKGPWMFKRHDGAGRTFEMKREFWEVGGGPDKAGVAFVFKGEANARLIAAAPEMYETLEAALIEFEACHEVMLLNLANRGMKEAAIIPQIRAALAKAIGK